jgi:hypothetical protein
MARLFVLRPWGGPAIVTVVCLLYIEVVAVVAGV